MNEKWYLGQILQAHEILKVACNKKLHFQQWGLSILN